MNNCFILVTRTHAKNILDRKLLRTVIQIHFHSCIEVNTTINGTFDRVVIHANKNKSRKCRIYLRIANILAFVMKV
jgi:hypothetical protein